VKRFAITNPAATKYLLKLDETLDLTKVPGLVFGESGKLASLYWLYALDQKALDNVDKDFDKILNIKKNEQSLNAFNTLIYSTRYEPIERADVFQKPDQLFKFQLHSVTSKILGDLSVKERQYLIWSIIEDFKDLMKSYRNEIDVTIVLPSIPQVDQFEFLMKKIENEYLTPNSKINLSIEIDPTIVKGYKLRLGHKNIDNTWNPDIKRANELEDQRNIQREKDFTSKLPLVYDVQLPSIEQNTAYAQKLIESVLGEKLNLSSLRKPNKKTSDEFSRAITGLLGSP